VKATVLRRLSLTNFRNYIRLEVELPPGVVVLMGDNAQGKTNLLEAIYYLALSRSPRTSLDRELVNWLAWKEEMPFARLEGEVERGEVLLRLEIVILPQRGPEGSRVHKQIMVNGVRQRALDLVGQVGVVLFRPEDLGLIDGPPSGRRRYLDVTLCQLDASYLRALQRYNRVLLQRNHLLRQLRERPRSWEELRFWDEHLVREGAFLILRRNEAIVKLGPLAGEVHSALTAGRERLELKYRSSPAWEEAPRASEESSLKELSQLFHRQLQEARDMEVQLGATSQGPHRDDLGFVLNGMEASIHASRSQLRTAALSLKLAEAQLMREESGCEPLLLLDDVLSELDGERRAHLAGALSGRPQVLITATDPASLPQELRRVAGLFRVKENRIEPFPASE